MPTQTFFIEATDQSEVKASIVEKYFATWAQIISATQQRVSSTDKTIAYVDLFAGPGRYKDGTESTPVRVLRQIIKDPTLAGRVVTIFNDKDPGHAGNLRETVKGIEGIEGLKYAPQILNIEVGEEIEKSLSSRKHIPILAFIDPWGYKGLSLNLVNSFLKDWGCDCIFFFNYNRINMGLGNELVAEHMNALFGPERADELRLELERIDPGKREATIVEALTQALKEHGHRYVLPFCFKHASGIRTSHHLIFVSKHPKGYDVMKGIMAKSSTLEEQGVASFTYNPADRIAHPLLFELNRPLDDLREMLLDEFQGKTLTMKAIFDRHNVDRPYTSGNYKKVLKEMEDAGDIKVINRTGKRGFADSLMVSFPIREK
jgi:three-Cys-motif partner protein